MRFVKDLAKGILGKPDPIELWEKIISQIPDEVFLKKDLKVLCPAFGHGTEADVVVKRMLSLGRSTDEIKDSIYLVDKYKVFTKDAIRKGYKHVFKSDFMQWETDVKFDIVLGSPPFSSHGEGKSSGKRGRELYIDFFKRAVEMAPIVALVMPTTNKKVQEKHNNLLKEKANVIEFISNDVFNVIMPMWYVLVDGSDKKPDVTFDISGVVGNKVKWSKGKVNMTGYKQRTGDHGKEQPDKEHTVTIYHKLNSKNGLVTKYGKPEDFKKHEYFPDTGYAVLMPQTITDNGWSTVEVVKCNGNQVAFNGMSIVFTETKEQAQQLIDVMNTESFKEQANNVKQGFNNMNISCLTAIQIDDKVVESIFGKTTKNS
jgi:hypothetical protein